MTTLILTPLQSELNFFLEGCHRLSIGTRDIVSGRLPAVELAGGKAIVARGGTGKVQFAVHTQHLLDSGPDWDLLICAGAAGALADDLAIGDIVVAIDTVEHDYNNRFSQRPLPLFTGSVPFIDDLRRSVDPSWPFGVHFGRVASGDEDIVSEQRRRSLRRSTNALVAAWEGAGGARAAAFNNVPFIEIRGVTDVADENAPSAFESNLSQTMKNIATLIVSWL